MLPLHVMAVACLNASHNALSNAMSRPPISQVNTRFRVLRLLQDRPDLTQREIAEHLGISLGGVNYCLRIMESASVVGGTVGGE